MAKSLCHLLMKVNHAIVENFYVANMSLNAIHESKILAKISEFTVNIFAWWVILHVFLSSAVNFQI